MYCGSSATNVIIHVVWNKDYETRITTVSLPTTCIVNLAQGFGMHARWTPCSETFYRKLQQEITDLLVHII